MINKRIIEYLEILDQIQYLSDEQVLEVGEATLNSIYFKRTQKSTIDILYPSL